MRDEGWTDVAVIGGGVREDDKRRNMGSEGWVKGEVPLCWSPVGKDGFRRESTRGNRKGRGRLFGEGE